MISAQQLRALTVGLLLGLSTIFSPSRVDAFEQADDPIIRYHAKLTPPGELREIWVELKPDGTPLRARMDLLSPDDGPKVVLLSDNKADVWFQKKNSFLTIRDAKTLQEVMKMRAIYDPKLALEELQAAEKAGKSKVETKQPAKDGEPVTLTVASKDASDRREVYEIDAKTKLVSRVIDYRREGDQWKLISQRDYLDYNREIDPKIFQPEMPKDVVRIDQIHQTIGLEKGNLSDDEIAMKVAKDFFESLIAEDYQKAGSIFSGMPAEKMKELFSRLKFHRIVEVGKPKPAPNPLMKAIQVPVKVEMETDGKKEIREFSPYVRPVHTQPDRWEIIGGI